MMWTRRKFLGTTCNGVGAAIGSQMLKSAKDSYPLFQVDGGGVHASCGEKAVSSARGVLRRLLGERATDFELRWIDCENGHDAFEYSAAQGRVSVGGSSGVAVCRGAYTYLRNFCRAMVCWSGRHLDLPTRFPDAPHRRVVCPYQFTQYMNPCTFGYTAAFWDWSRWERELDWMALHGINMPLAMEGQESVWRSVWQSMGLEPMELECYFAGPAYLPWQRMGNINHFEGPLPQNWIERKRDLQIAILNQMRSLGMTPIAPGFAGFVPQGFNRLHPQARTIARLWLPSEFHTIPRSTRTFVLHPGERDYYREIGRCFINSYKATYGEVGYYLADTFNEMEVPVSEAHRYEELKQFGRTVYEGIQAGDENGTWVMQSWPFVSSSGFWDNRSIAALLEDVPADRMLILDYANDLPEMPGSKYAPNCWKRSHAFFGKPWINGMAHTFGGNNNVKGDLHRMASQPARVLADPDRGQLLGWGICPEGTENNEVVYELMTDMGWSEQEIDLARWIPQYCNARYGACPPAMEQAWKLLMASAYRAHIWMTKQGWQAAPCLKPKAVGVNADEKFWQATELFLSCSPQLVANELYRYDLVELVAQSAGGAVDRQLTAAGTAHQAGRVKERDERVAEAEAMLLRMDALIATRPDRRLENWTHAAAAWAVSPAEAAYYEQDARRLLTSWGWPELWDYASRVWSGLIRDFYLPRWRTYYRGLRENSPVSIDLWQETWLSSVYEPSEAGRVTNLPGECKSILQTCKGWAV